jgi:hypothetical protein
VFHVMISTHIKYDPNGLEVLSGYGATANFGNTDGRVGVVVGYI